MQLRLRQLFKNLSDQVQWKQVTSHLIWWCLRPQKAAHCFCFQKPEGRHLKNKATRLVQLLSAVFIQQKNSWKMFLSFPPSFQVFIFTFVLTHKTRLNRQRCPVNDPAIYCDIISVSLTLAPGQQERQPPPTCPPTPSISRNSSRRTPPSAVASGTLNCPPGTTCVFATYSIATSIGSDGTPSQRAVPVPVDRWRCRQRINICTEDYVSERLWWTMVVLRSRDGHK